MLAEARGAEGLDPTQADRARDVTLLTGGSRLQKGPLSIVQFKPVGRFDLDPASKTRAAELRLEMKQAAKNISSRTDLMREAARAGIASQVKSLARENTRALSEEKGFDLER